MVTEEFGILLPRQFLPPSSVTEPLSPDFADCPVELPEAPGIRPTSVILIVDLVAHHDPESDPEFPSYRDPRFSHPFLYQFVSIEAFQLWI